ncbi:hypothetical protein FVE85_8037 [Porphyridium purpureum]|uniref:Mitochondrial fission protein ELM1 n=1 Tax=Porphyridium purpureum TaxID=35688 RepID=A0A5J4YNL7_PORPP|nr:hypothetical protein FVE85_8037 [Porphyridium purpureum]|eukprot:POR8157..scf295_9
MRNAHVSDGVATDSEGARSWMNRVGIRVVLNAARTWCATPQGWDEALESVRSVNDQRLQTSSGHPQELVVVSAGGWSCVVGVALKQSLASTGQVVLVQVLHPRVCAREVDVLVAPRHDMLLHVRDTYGSKWVRTQGALGASVCTPKQRMRSSAGASAPPHITVWIGGARRRWLRWDYERRVMAAVKTLTALKPPFRVTIITSRRSGARLETALCAEIAKQNETRLVVLRFKDTQANPDILRALREDHVHVCCVTDDSVSMLSEVASSGNPLLILRVSPRLLSSQRLEMFVAELATHSHVRAFDPLSNDAQRTQESLTQLASDKASHRAAFRYHLRTLRQLQRVRMAVEAVRTTAAAAAQPAPTGGRPR